MKLTKALLGICTALTVATAAHAKHIVLESQPLDKALTSLSIKTGAKVYWKAADVQNITIERTEGDDTKLKDLLASLLSGTGLKSTISADGQSVFIAKGNFMVGDVAAYPIIGASILDMQQSALLDKNNLQAAEEEDFDDSEIYYQLDELDVTANRLDNVRNVAMGVHKITAEEMLTIPTAFGEMDIIKVIQTLPGVKSLGEGTSGFSVRGGATDQNLVLFNDNTIYNPNHLFGFFSAINGNIVDNIELYKCNIPSQYGGRLSSVLDINSKRGNKQKFTGNASLGVLASSLNLEGPIVKDRTSLLLSARASYSDWILGLIPEKSGYKNGRAGFYDANLVLSHKFTSLDHLHVSGYYSHDRFKFEEGQKYAYCNANASAKYVHLFGGESPLEITGGFDHYDYSTSEYFNPYDAYTLSYRINQYFGKADFTMKSIEKHKIRFGASATYYDVMPGKTEPYSSESLYRYQILQNENALEAAAYANEEWDITDRFSLSAGVRFSLFQAMGPRTYYLYQDGELPTESNIVEQKTTDGNIKTYMGPEFRGSLRYMITPDLSIKAGVNSMRQYIHKISNTLVPSPTDIWKLSDANITPQTGVQYALGVYRNFENGNIETSIEGYYKTMNDYLDYRSGAILLMNDHLETDVLPTQGYAYGVEFMVKRSKGKLNGWASYTYSRTMLRQNDPRIINPTNDGDWYASDYDRPHEFKLVGNYQFTQRYSISLNADYSTGRPLTVPVAKYYDNTINSYTFFYSDRNSTRIPNYFRMDLAFNVKPTHRLNARLHTFFTIGVYNVTARKNAYSIFFRSENGVIKGYKMSVFGCPIPYVSFNIKF